MGKTKAFNEVPRFFFFFKGRLINPSSSLLFLFIFFKSKRIKSDDGGYDRKYQRIRFLTARVKKKLSTR